MSEMNKEYTYIGIDPGKDGALAVLYPDGSVYVLPFDKAGYVSVLTGLHEGYVKAILEHVGAMPGQGSVSMFHFGENFGWLQGVLDTLMIPYELVRPQKWKKEFSCTSDKNTSIKVAKRLFPKTDLRRTPKCKGPHDGICEALLMAEYGRRHA